MPDTEPAAQPPAEVEVAFPAALGLPEAREAAARLQEALAAAQAGGAALAIEIHEGPAHPAALQLLVAAERSAAAAGLTLRLGPRAAAARATVTPAAPGAAP